MVEEWASNNHQCSIGMVKIFIKYAKKDVEKAAIEIEKHSLALQEICGVDEFKFEMEKIQARLDKVEDEILAKKQRKFHCDECDYEKEQILTFARKYEHLRENQDNRGLQQSARNTEVSSVAPNGAQEKIVKEIVESEMSESDVSSHSESEGVKSKILEEFNLLAQGRVKAQRGRGAISFRACRRGGRGESKSSGLRQRDIKSTWGIRTRGQTATNP
ncbi:hypothetical protein NDU88_003621 [Pleurodeles waltl]|uniref:Uncharacterized protein n=1 Tax=Pleurodeles waltl TaxID=8319 RepID=A0AAV7UDU5_PLEWA|nr:hypothetical protein NDU88_003621 [Pleurodeles waltl]